ncbi:MAG: antibiotic biosynthesis monooxygenase [Cytophagaceae bacterium]|nr:antibiotic biosynthesis monooxygenase [Cytophagaceae bacterium]
MIVRIVKMTFREGAEKDFIKIFQGSKKQIRESRGCIFLELLQDKDQPNLFITYSVWSSEKDLERYRDSDLFKDTWAKTKALFGGEPEVHTMERIEKT